MASPTDAELLAKLAALREQIAAAEGRLTAYQQARDVAEALARVGKELTETLDVAQVSERKATGRPSGFPSSPGAR